MQALLHYCCASSVSSLNQSWQLVPLCMSAGKPILLYPKNNAPSATGRRLSSVPAPSEGAAPTPGLSSGWQPAHRRYPVLTSPLELQPQDELPLGRAGQRSLLGAAGAATTADRLPGVRLVGGRVADQVARMLQPTGGWLYVVWSADHLLQLGCRLA